MDYDDYRKESKPVFTANDMSAATNVGYANGIARGRREARKIMHDVIARYENYDWLEMRADQLLDIIDEALA